MNRLTVVIVNYNSKDYLEKCVDSVYAQTQLKPLGVVVIDNASEDRDFSELQRRHASLQVICNDVNVGFSTACNQGIRHCPADFYLFLNPDCLVVEGAIDETLAFLESRPEVGIATCRVTNPDGSLQLACRRSIPRPSTALYRFLRLSRVFPRSKKFARYNLGYLDDNETHEVEAVSGSFLMFRKEILADAGFMDEDFFLYGEDLDFCYRAFLKGWKVFYFAGARVTHFKRRSSSRNSDISNYHYYKSMEIFYRKHFRSQAGPVQNAAVFAGIRFLHLINRVRRLVLKRDEVGSDW